MFTTEEKLTIAIEALDRVREGTFNLLLADAVIFRQSRPFTIDGPGEYRMRNGMETTVLCIDAPGDQPAVAYHMSEGDLYAGCYSLDGRYFSKCEASEYDIVSRA